MFGVDTEDRYDVDRDDVVYIGVINVSFSDWPMSRELWRSSPHEIEEDANRAAHDQLCDALRFLLNSRENGVSV